MVGENKDPSNPKEVAASVFGAVVVYAVRISILQYLCFTIFSPALDMKVDYWTTTKRGMKGIRGGTCLNT